jgi:alanyl-tRNA synthetase
MLGSWSLGDYDHPQSLRWGYELLRDGFGISPDRLYATVFGGDEQVGPDTGAIDTWRALGVPVELTGDENWWSNGPTGPSGPDSEMFVWTGDTPPRGTPSTDPHWVELWNHVGMRYHRGEDGGLTPLVQSNVDTGMGLERLVTVLQNKPSVYESDLFEPLMRTVSGLWTPDQQSLRLIVDHLRSIVVIIGDGIRPSNTGRGYVLRRLIRRMLTTLWRDDPTRTVSDFPDGPIEQTLEHFRQPVDVERVREVLVDEERRFRTLVERGRGVVERHLSRRGTGGPLTDGDYEYLHDTHGLPRDLVDSLLP